jgi:hypothetical protein
VPGIARLRLYLPALCHRRVHGELAAIFFLSSALQFDDTSCSRFTKFFHCGLGGEPVEKENDLTGHRELSG